MNKTMLAIVALIASIYLANDAVHTWGRLVNGDGTPGKEIADGMAKAKKDIEDVQNDLKKSALKDSAEPPITGEQLTIVPGQPLARQGTLQTNQVMFYRLTGLQQNQTLVANVHGGAKMSIVAPNGQPVDFRSTEVVDWNGTFLVSGDYTVKIMLPDTVPTGLYTLTVNAGPSAKNYQHE
jgi:hypothetical protein